MARKKCSSRDESPAPPKPDKMHAFFAQHDTEKETCAGYIRAG